MQKYKLWKHPQKCTSLNGDFTHQKTASQMGTYILGYESNRTKYYYGNGLIATAPLGESNKNYYLYDGHGSVTQLTDTSGTTIADYRYDAFGNQLHPEKPTVYNPFRYSGEYTDAETGMTYLRARYYDPSIGRFISEDSHWNINNMIYGDNSGDIPVPSISAIMQSGNLYAYCTNDPVNAWDPTGCLEDKDKEILTKDDYQKVKMLTAIYNWAKEQNDDWTADMMHYAAVRIRQNPKYNNTAYGEPRIPNDHATVPTFATLLGYQDKYDYKTDVNKKRVSVIFSGEYSADDIGWASGTGISWAAEAWSDTGYDALDLAVTFLAEPIARLNPLYGKMEVGDRSAVVTRKNEKTAIVKWTKTFYFHMRENNAELYHIK